MLFGLMVALTIYQFKKYAVQMDGMGHHRVIYQFHPDPFIVIETDGIILNRAIFLAVEGPHIALHIPSEVEFHLAVRWALLMVRFQ